MYLRNILEEIHARNIKVFGDIIQVTDMKINPKSKALVTSPRGLYFHTDRHKCDIIAWYCIKQSSEGGDSIFIDDKEIVKEITDTEKLKLLKIQLH